MHQPFRFLHASDLHLEAPPTGLTEVSDTLRDTLIEAPHRAATRVFDAAIKEAVDFVVLAGDVVQPTLAGPRGLVFLEQQFERLAAANIRVYWAAGPADQLEIFEESWPLGENVIRFPVGRTLRLIHHRQGEPLCQLVGTSNSALRRIHAADFHGELNPLFTVAVTHGLGRGVNLAEQGVHYWALGGKHRRRTLDARGAMVHYPGSPQARNPRRTGPHGCTLVEVDQRRHVRTRFIATDAIRYTHERIAIEGIATPETLFAQLSTRLLELTADPFGPEMLIQWTIACDRACAQALTHGRLANDLIARLRTEHSARRPGGWTLAIEPARADLATEIYEEQSVRGEFLRTVRGHALEDDAALDLTPYLGRAPANVVRRAASLDDPRRRMHVLADVAQLGSLLLTGAEDFRPHEARQ